MLLIIVDKKSKHQVIVQYDIHCLPKLFLMSQVHTGNHSDTAYQNESETGTSKEFSHNFST